MPTDDARARGFESQGEHLLEDPAVLRGDQTEPVRASLPTLPKHGTGKPWMQPLLPAHCRLPVRRRHEPLGVQIEYKEMQLEQVLWLA